MAVYCQLEGNMAKKSARSKFGQAVKKLRKKYFWTQERLAKRAGISKSYLQKIEGKNPPNVTIDTIKKIADVFRRGMSDLLI
jgi:transcriptional regulator with XRE-family HTH domain